MKYGITSGEEKNFFVLWCDELRGDFEDTKMETAS